jgi:hypothetical protein
MLVPIVRRLLEHGVCHVGVQDLTVVTLIEHAMDGAKVAMHLDVERATDAFLAPLNVDLYLSQRHELGMEPGRTTSVLRTILLDGLRGGSAGVSE